jgi:hypothetical protein
VRVAAILVVVSACKHPPPAQPRDEEPVAVDPSQPAPRIELAAVAHETLCVTKGSITLRAASGGEALAVDEPTVRAFARGSSGDAAMLRFAFRGNSKRVRELASGQARRQLGLKLRAENGCNLVYVMWRLDPKPMLEVSVKRNPGMRRHEECGAEGYTKVKPNSFAPPLEPGATHTLAAQIVDDELIATIDGRVAWRGRLPPQARELHGPSGLRSDNVAFDILEFAAPAGPAMAGCRHEETD